MRRRHERLATTCALSALAASSGHKTGGSLSNSVLGRTGTCLTTRPLRCMASCLATTGSNPRGLEKKVDLAKWRNEQPWLSVTHADSRCLIRPQRHVPRMTASGSQHTITFLLSATPVTQGSAVGTATSHLAGTTTSAVTWSDARRVVASASHAGARTAGSDAATQQGTRHTHRELAARGRKQPSQEGNCTWATDGRFISHGAKPHASSNGPEALVPIEDGARSHVLAWKMAAGLFQPA